MGKSNDQNRLAERPDGAGIRIASVMRSGYRSGQESSGTGPPSEAWTSPSLLLKAPDVARLLRRNLLELGVAGDEWLMETGTRTDHRCFETRSYSASVCLLTATAIRARPGSSALSLPPIPIWPADC